LTVYRKMDIGSIQRIGPHDLDRKTPTGLKRDRSGRRSSGAFVQLGGGPWLGLSSILSASLVPCRHGEAMCEKNAPNIGFVSIGVDLRHGVRTEGYVIERRQLMQTISHENKIGKTGKSSRVSCADFTQRVMPATWLKRGIRPKQSRIAAPENGPAGFSSIPGHRSVAGVIYRSQDFGNWAMVWP
jgi:hypothetical protein